MRAGEGTRPARARLHPWGYSQRVPTQARLKDPLTFVLRCSPLSDSVAAVSVPLDPSSLAHMKGVGWGGAAPGCP